MSSSPPRPPSPSTTTSLRPNVSVRSSSRPRLATVVVTVPPWARDEPPSPTEQPSSTEQDYLRVSESRPSDLGSLSSAAPPSRWWTFTLPRPREHTSPEDDELLKPPERKTQNYSLKDRSMSWLPTSPSAAFREGSSFSRMKPDKPPPMSQRRDVNMFIAMPATSMTVAHTQTPGWETPWTSRVGAQGPPRSRQPEEDDGYGFGDLENTPSIASTKDLSKWSRRKKRLRTFILTNTYVPLIFRFINITFTAAALGVAIRVRQRERQHGIMGAVGSSPTLVIIFAPLTMVHILYAIYLEYFGRPLGLWRTSRKLAHTLFDVLFICMWSAALSLCFDNYFTSLVPCASESTTSWYNQLPRPASNLPTFEGSIGDTICDSQVALIALVGIGLLMYCTNLVISLFRIFEKVKYHPERLPS